MLTITTALIVERRAVGFDCRQQSGRLVIEIMTGRSRQYIVNVPDDCKSCELALLAVSKCSVCPRQMGNVAVSNRASIGLHRRPLFHSQYTLTTALVRVGEVSWVDRYAGKCAMQEHVTCTSIKTRLLHAAYAGALQDRPLRCFAQCLHAFGRDVPHCLDFPWTS